jgi:multicomponent Na+:H+ antiporter subunit G
MPPITDLLAGICLLVGAFFVLAAAVGILRMPDVYTRMHAATKSGTLGSGLMLVGVAVHAGDSAVVLRALAAVLFLVATTPIAAHLLGRAAYMSGVPTWHGTAFDELKGRYDVEARRLAAAEDAPTTDRVDPERDADKAEIQPS